MPTLDWIGKKAVVNHHREVPYHLLKCDRKLSVGAAGSGNLLVQGDNLVALKALLPYYAGKVKCIYIDPPYNTGNENWVYNDAVNSPEIRKWLGKVVGAEAEDLSRHDKWLCMMYPRLVLLKQFLRRDGAIFVSIDDNEIAPLKFLMDEVFGQRNFVAQIVVEANRRGQTYKQISKTHEYIVCYGSSDNTVLREIETSGENLDRRDEWGAYSARELRNRNPKFGRSNRPNLFFPIYIDPQPANSEGHHRLLAERGEGTMETLPLNSKGGESCWRWGQQKLLEAIAQGLRVVYASRTRNGEWRVFEKYRKETIKPKSLWTETDFISEQGTNLLRQLGLGEHFQFPKPVALIRRVLEIATDKDSLVLDSFAGSGTTGHAVLALNKADGGNRRFILVEMEPEICQTVTAQRLQRVIEGYTNAKGEEVAGLGGGFRYCRLGPSVFDETGSIRAGVTFGQLAAHVYFAETGEPIPKRPSPHPSPPPKGQQPSPRPSPASGRGGRKWSPLLGVHHGKAIYLLFNGILGDKSPQGGNVLTGKTLARLPEPPLRQPSPRGRRGVVKVVYGEGCRLGKPRLKREGIVFKQIPYGIKVT